MRLRTDRFTMRRMRSKFMLALFGTCMSKAAVSHLREVSVGFKVPSVVLPDQRCLP